MALHDRSLRPPCVSLFSIMSYVHSPCVLYEVAIHLEVCVLLLPGLPTSQRPRATFLAKSHIIHMMGTHERNPITSSLTHILLLSYIYCKYHTRQWQNFTSHLFLCLLFSGTSILRATWNWAMSHMWLTSRGLATPVLLYSVSAQNENELVQYLNAFQLVTVNCKLCFWSVQNLSDGAKVAVDFSGAFI